MSAPRSLVLGGNGFLGSHVAEYLSDNGHAVTIFDRNASSGRRDDVKLTIGDISKLEDVQAAVEGSDYVFNFAAIADIGDALSRPVEAGAINIMGTLHALEASRQSGVKRFVQASSIYVFSRSGGIYRSTKLAAENLVETYQQHYGLDFTVLRFGSLYGRRADRNNSIRRMVREALTEGRITYHGDENAVREYVHVTDAARLTHEILAEEFRNQHVVLTGQERMRIIEVMTMIKEMLAPNLDVELRFQPAEGHYAMTPYNFSPSIGRKLASNSYVDMGQGILDCVNEAYGEIGDSTESTPFVDLSESS